MKEFLAVIVAVMLASEAGAETLSDSLRALVTGHVDRFEGSGMLTCPDFSTPNLTPFVQYRSDDSAGGQGISAGFAASHAPYIWLSDTEGRLVVSFTSLVRGEWIYCDDDGDEWERSKDYWFQSRYMTGESGGGLRLNLLGFSAGRNPGIGTSPEPSQYLQRVDLLDGFFVYNDPIVNGPAEHFTFMTPPTIDLRIAVRSDGFTIEFQNACGSGVPATAVYVRSTCSESGWCSEFPHSLPGL